MKNINFSNNVKYKFSMLEIAVWSDATKIVEYFKKRTIDDMELKYLIKVYKNIKNINGDTLLGELGLYRSIRDKHAKGFHKFCLPEIINGHHKLIRSSFLSIAVEFCCEAFVPELLRKSVYNKEIWDTAINDAKKFKRNKIENYIKQRMEMIESRLKTNFSLLHTAVVDNDPEMVGYIVEKHIEFININHNVFGTALALAHSLCHRKCISVLEQFNINTNTQNEFMQTPLHEAISSGTTDYCKILIERSEDIDITGFNNLTALHCAVIHGRDELYAQLVHRGASCTQYGNPSLNFVLHDETVLKPAVSNESMTDSSHGSEKLFEIKPNAEEDKKEEIQFDDDMSNKKQNIDIIINKEIILHGNENKCETNIVNQNNIKKNYEAIKNNMNDLLHGKPDDIEQKIRTYVDCSEEVNHDNLEESLMSLFNDAKKENLSSNNERIIKKLKTRIRMLINLLIHDKGLDFSHSMYKLLSTICVSVRFCQDIDLFPLLNAIIEGFDRDYKMEIAGKILNETQLNEDERLRMNCLQLSIYTTAVYIENNLSMHYIYNDFIIMSLFEDIANSESTNPIMMRICEAILYLFCSILKLKNKTINYEFWNAGLKKYFEDASMPDEIRLAACVGLVEINSTRNLELTMETKLKIINYLFKVEDKEEYLGFKKEEISHAFESAKKMYWSFSHMRLNPNEDVDSLWERANVILRSALQMSGSKRCDSTSLILKITYEVLKVFKNQFKQSIIDKLQQDASKTSKSRESFDKRNRAVINCFCNALNFIGQCVFIELEPFLNDVYDTVYKCLESFEKFCDQNMYLIRICEVLLYCLCNIAQTKGLSEIHAWHDLLWDYFNNCKSSRQVTMAAAISYAYVNTENVMGDKVSKIRTFLTKIYEQPLDEHKNNYLGFSMQEIGNAISRCPSGREEDHIADLKTKNILILTRKESVLTLNLKIHGTINERFLLNGSGFACCDELGNSLLHLAAVRLNSKICELLLENYCKIDEVNNEGNNCLQELLLNFDESTATDNIDKIIEIVNILINNKVNLAAKTKTGINILQLASRLKSEKLFLTLLSNSSEEMITKRDFELPFKNKWRECQEEMFQMLPDERLSKFITEDYITRFLKDANLKILTFWILKSTDNVRTLVLEDVLYYAATKDYETLFDDLIKVDLQTLKLFANGETFMTNLIRDKNRKYYDKLLASDKALAYINKFNEDNQTPLQIAMEMENIELIKTIIIKIVEKNETENVSEALDQLLQKILTCENITTKEGLYEILQKMNDKNVNWYLIRSKTNESKKNIKRTVLSLQHATEKNSERIIEILTDKKCLTCKTEGIEYVFECGDTYCSKCGKTLNKCMIPHVPSKTPKFLLPKFLR